MLGRAKETLDGELAHLGKKVAKEAAVDARLDTVLGAYAERKKQFAAAASALDKALETLDITADSGWTLDESLHAIVSTVERERAAFAEASSTIRSLEAQVEELTSERDGLTAERDAMAESVAGLQAQLADATAQAQEKIDELGAQLAGAHGKARALETELATTRTKLAAAEAEVTRLGKVQETIDAMTRAHEEQLAKSKAILDKASATVERLEEEMAAKDEQIAEVTSLKEKLNMAELDKAELQSRLEKAKADLHEQKSRMDVLVDKGGDANAQMDYRKGEGARHAPVGTAAVWPARAARASVGEDPHR